MPGREGEVSAELLAAQQQLNDLRKRQRMERAAQGSPVLTDDHGRLIQAQGRGLREIAEMLPGHLGWESAGVISVLRREKNQLSIVHCQLSIVNEGESFPHRLDSIVNRQSKIVNSSSIRLYPDLALGMLRQKQVTTGRIWLLLRYLDKTGRGWIATGETREQLTGQGSALRVCSWRQLRNLLAQGEGVFWQVEDGRIWLFSVAKVAASLQIQCLQGRPIALPVSVLTQGIKAVRAHFYASFHTGRAGKPITRTTLATISQVSPRSQRRYDVQAKVEKRPNFAVGAKATAENQQVCAWQHGQAMFQLIDHKGKQGPAGAKYLAWQLPNSYIGPHQLMSRGRQKRINRELVDLLHQGTTGNGRNKVDRRFYGNGAIAAKAFNRSAKQDIYWQGTPGTWYCLAGRSSQEFPRVLTRSGTCGNL